MAYSVSEINQMAAELFAANPVFNGIQVFGEISGGKLYPSGHFYFTLKDENSAISCVMFKFAYNRLEFKPENGMQVSLTANASIYEKTGRFQLIVQNMKPKGVGDLHQQFELLKKELAAKGYFDQKNKKPIPELPLIIGVATSPAGAVIQDILNVLRRRFPGFRMHFIPIAVQGEGAALQIAQAINIFNLRKEVEVIVIARGGGSIEDLWAFNEKVVADAIFASKISVVSAIGHETDFTIADFTADLRAPTPSAAAELIVPEKKSLYRILSQNREQLERALNRELLDAQKTLNNLINRPVFTRPTSIIEQKRQLIDDYSKRILPKYSRIIYENRSTISNLQGRILREIKHLTVGKKQAMLEIKDRLNYNINNQFQYKLQQLGNLMAKLEALNPFSILERGYTYIEDSEGRIIDSASNAEVGQEIAIRWHDGSAKSLISEIILEKDVEANK